MRLSFERQFKIEFFTTVYRWQKMLRASQAGLYASCKVTGTKINRGIGVGLETPIEVTFVGKETASERLKKALHRINLMTEKKNF